MAYSGVLKIGAVPYLNALPLCRYLPGPVRFETPSQLEKLMESGDMDVALIPSLAFLKNPALIPHFDGGIIGSDGPVESVALLLKPGIRGPENIRTISVTSDSVTSAALLKILFGMKWRLPFPPSSPRPDALLKIGDEALFFNEPGYTIIDLGKEWTEWTGLPFIYALWVSTRPHEGLTDILVRAKNEGLKRIEEIVFSCRDLPPGRLLPYLTQSIRYEISPEGMKGLELFKTYCLSLGLI